LQNNKKDNVYAAVKTQKKKNACSHMQGVETAKFSGLESGALGLILKINFGSNIS
jgi:hypothetical protein